MLKIRVGLVLGLGYYPGTVRIWIRVRARIRIWVRVRFKVGEG